MFLEQKTTSSRTTTQDHGGNKQFIFTQYKWIALNGERPRGQEVKGYGAITAQKLI